MDKSDPRQGAFHPFEVIHEPVEIEHQKVSEHGVPGRVFSKEIRRRTVPASHGHGVRVPDKVRTV